MSPFGMPGGDTPSKDSWMEKCVGGIKGTNKRTGQPYTEGDKIAICKAQWMKTKGAQVDTVKCPKCGMSVVPDSEDECPNCGADLTDVESTIDIDKTILDRVDLVSMLAVNKLISFGQAKTTREAQSIYQSLLEKANYDLDALTKLI